MERNLIELIITDKLNARSLNVLSTNLGCDYQRLINIWSFEYEPNC